MPAPCQPWSHAVHAEDWVEKVYTVHDKELLAVLLAPTFRLSEAIESHFAASVCIRGNEFTIRGLPTTVDAIARLLTRLLETIEATGELSKADLSRAMSRLEPEPIAAQLGLNDVGQVGVARDRDYFLVKRQRVFARNPAQQRYIDLMSQRLLVFALGPAGTGKTHLAVAYGLSLLLSGNVDKMVLSRPAIEAGERLGFLPGDMREKVDPYFRPIYDVLDTYLGREQTNRYIEQNRIEIAPLAFMRGRTLARTFVLLDEGQNATKSQMKMFLTRFGARSQMVVTGDPQQSDLPSGVHSGLAYSASLLDELDDVGVMTFGARDVVRHALVGEILTIWERDHARQSSDQR